MESSRWSLTLHSGIVGGSYAAVRHGSLPPSDAIMTGCRIVGLTKVFSFPLSPCPATGTAMVHGAGGGGAGYVCTEWCTAPAYLPLHQILVHSLLYCTVIRCFGACQP